MKEMLPTSKSSYKEIQKCPYHWYGTHILGKRDEAGKAALIGLDVEHVWTRMLRYDLDMDSALTFLTYEESKELLLNAIAITEIVEGITEYQTRIYVDESGYRALNSNGILLAIMDRTTIGQTETLVQDLKCGQEYRDWFEINAYVAAGRALNPFVDRVRFQYLWAKTCRVEEYIFDFDGSNAVTVTLPGGEKQVHHDWWTNIAVNILSLQDVEPNPKPGEHCSSWYGKTCHLIGSCPAHEKTNIMVKEASPNTTNTTAILLKALANDEHVELGPLMASEALGAVLHAEAFLGKIKGKLQDWSKVNGPINVGGVEYSYQTRESLDVDAAQALKAMFESGMHFSEMAKAVNISKSSLGKLPKSFAEIREYILNYCATNNKETVAWGKKKAG